MAKGKKKGGRGGLQAHFRKEPDKSFTPFRTPSRPPVGYYDPGLDASERASQRGLFDLLQDTNTQNLRSRNDFQLGLGQIGTNRLRETQDYNRGISDLERSFQRLGIGQNQTARAAGASSGALVQAMRKRTSNQEYARQPIDVAHQRNQADLDTQTGQLTTEFNRDWQDRNTVTVPRAKREATAFSLDTNAQRFFQAKQAGAPLLSKPSNERTVAGQTFRVQNPKAPLGQRTYLLPSGQTLGRKGLVNTIRKRRKAGGKAPLYG